ncbi:N-acetylmuramate alpha-1-phosphate uridylyltransferase MurU [Parvibium lacunae]|uniref:Nucleotidyltransferase family protein n=1 Tax=Parvibium lacunae TaxID=1888893 RepID=A0A368L536_9BURK|nr:nucleotidyltransferase family protein [Parvibium lacunae]RCS58701.1 nucleotidyltransferase family protein [Parvibium lacunae]
MPAMILAAGRGERMRPLTDHSPKPLLVAGGKRLIEWQIERLHAAGIREIVINHAWLGAQIPAALGQGERYGVALQYSPENPALETAGGIAKAFSLIAHDYLLVTNGDIYCDYPYAQLIQRLPALEHSRLLAWLVLVDNPPHHPRGDFGLNEAQITLPEREQAHPTNPTYTFSGIGLYHRKLFDSLAIDTPAPLAPLLHMAIKTNQLGGEYYQGVWHDIGTPARLAALDAQLTGQPDITLPN